MARMILPGPDSPGLWARYYARQLALLPAPPGGEVLDGCQVHQPDVAGRSSTPPPPTPEQADRLRRLLAWQPPPEDRPPR